MYFSVHHKLAACLGFMARRLFLMPHPTAIGNASEDYLFGLIYAIKHKRKLVLIMPHQILSVTGLKMFSYDLFYYSNQTVAINHSSGIDKLVSFSVSSYFFTSRLLAKILFKLLKIKLPDVYYHPSLGQDIIWQPRSSRCFDWTSVAEIDLDNLFENKKLKLELPPEIGEKCERLFEEFRLPKDAWFVCIHVREGGYSEDFENIRNADINNYIEAIQYITNRGGWVFRMGDPSMKRLPPMEHVIDYANSRNRNALMDSFLIANCKYFVGTSSGILDTAILFNKPILLTNAVHWLMQLPQKRSDLIIFKHVHNKQDGRKLTLRQWLLSYKQLEPSSWSSSEWYYLENSSQEILEAVKELIEPEGTQEFLQLQTDFRTLHLEVCRALSLTFKINENPRINTSDWYRLATNQLSWKGKVGKSYLAKNW